MENRPQRRIVARQTTAFRSLLTAVIALSLIVVPGVSTPAPATNEVSSAGTEFWLAFPPNAPCPSWGTHNGRSLFIASEDGATGTVAVPGLNFTTPFTVGAGQIIEVDLFSGVLVNQVDIDICSLLDIGGTSRFDGVVDRGIHVTADKPVSVVGLNVMDYITDAFLGLPVAALGREYWVVGQTDTTGAGSSVTVVATENGTNVEITLPVDTDDGQGNQRTQGEAFTVSLNKGEVYQLTHLREDLSGTRVVSNKPVGVFASAACTNVPQGTWACDHIVSMLTPVSSWGENFAVMRLDGRVGNGFMLRVMAARPNTDVTITVVGGATETVTLQAGEFHQTALLDQAVSVQATGPVVVAQYAKGGMNSNDVGDPFMTLIPPVEQFLTGYTIATAGTRFQVGANPNRVSGHWVSLITTAVGKTQVTIEGTAVSGTWTQIADDWYGINVNLANGAHRIQTSGEPLGVFAYGWTEYESYSYPGGLAFRALVAEQLTPSVFATPAEPTTSGGPSPVLIPSSGQLPKFAPGQGGMFVAGQEQPVTITPVREAQMTRAVRVSGDGFAIELEPADEDASRGRGQVNGTEILLVQGEGVQTRMTGFAPNTPATLWLFSEPVMLGQFMVDGSGTLTASVAMLPEGIEACQHTVQVVGVLPNGVQVAANLGVWVLANPYPFDDAAPLSTHGPAIGCLESLGVVEGFGAAKYRQDSPATLGQTATMLSRLLSLPGYEPAQARSETTRHTPGMSALEQAGLSAVFGPSGFRSDALLTRGQLARLLVLAYDVAPENHTVRDVTGPDAGAIGALVKAGVMTGYADGSFRPDTPITRGQLASVLVRARQRLS